MATVPPRVFGDLRQGGLGQLLLVDLHPLEVEDGGPAHDIAERLRYSPAVRVAVGARYRSRSGQITIYPFISRYNRIGLIS